MPRYRKIGTHLYALEIGEKEARRNAARKLGKPGNTVAVEKLCLALKDEDRHVRGNAAKALGRIGNPQAVASLCAVIDHDFALGVRRKAIIALGEIGDPAGVQALCRVVATGRNGLNENALTSLIAMGLPAVVALSQTLGATEASSVLGAQSALVHMCYRVRRHKDLSQGNVLYTIVSASALTPVQQVLALETLRVHRPRFWQPDLLGGDIPRFCERILLHEENASVRRNAQAILDYLSLGRAGDRNFAQERDSLLRGLSPTVAHGDENALLRASSASQTSAPDRKTWSKSLQAIKNRWFRRIFERE